MAGLTEVIGAGSPLSDVDERGAGGDVQDLVVAEGNRDIPEAPRHLSAGGVPPPAHAAPVDRGAGAEDPVATFSLAGQSRGSGQAMEKLELKWDKG